MKIKAIQINRSIILIFMKLKNYGMTLDLLKSPARTSDESRILVIGKILEKYWSAVVTYRSEKIRIISVRRSRKEEIDIYES